VKIDTMLFELGDAAEQARRLQDMGLDGCFTFEGPHDPFVPLIRAAGHADLDLMTKSGRWAEMPDLIDETMLSTIAVRGTPKRVASQIVDRFGGRCSRVGFYTPYAIADDLLAEVVAELRALYRTGT
jgi:hypothetical protein